MSTKKAILNVLKCNIKYRSSRPEVFCKKVFLKISQNSRWRPQDFNFIKKETLAQVFSSVFFYKNTFFTEHLWTSASGPCEGIHSDLVLFPFKDVLETILTFSPGFKVPYDWVVW